MSMSAPDIPDVHTAAADESLRYVALNRRINHDYGSFGQLFQDIIDPTLTAYPSWFAIAPFASRGAGRAQLGADIALAAARADRHLHGFMEDERLAASFLTAFASAFRHEAAFRGIAVSSLLDPRVFAVSQTRLVRLIAEAPGGDIIEKLGSIALTLRNLMTEGNRRIYADICGAGQDYFTWRRERGGAPSPGEVLSDFRPSAKEAAHIAFDFALEHRNDSPLPCDFGPIFPAMRGDSSPLIVAAFALYELAGQTTEIEAKNRLVAIGNNYLAYREQFDAAQPAFTPGRILEGEVDRLKLLAILTPGIDLAMRSGIWRFWEFADLHLPRRSADPLLSIATQYNWGLFEDRMIPIIDSFRLCYSNPAAMFPPPNPDPNEPA
jgi:hypothetical protein